MATYIAQLNPFTGELQLVLDATLLKIKGVVATTGDLPLTGNTENNCYIVKADDRLYTWNKSTPSGLITDWVDVGAVSSIDWSAITNKPSSSVADIDDAVSKKHTQGTDQKLDDGGVNEVAVADVKDAVDNKHSHANKAELDLVTDGDHDVRNDNPHTVTKAQVGLTNVPDLDTTDAVNNEHTHSNKAELDLVTDGDHDVRSDNPHTVTKAQVGLTNVPDLDTTDAVNNEHTHANKATLDTYDQTNADISDAISKKHTQNSDTKLDEGQANEVTSAQLKNLVSNALLNTSIDDFTIKYEDSQLKVADRIENNIMLLAFYRAVDNSKSKFGLDNEYMDEYEDQTGIDTGNSINEAYDSTDDYYEPARDPMGLDSDTKLLMHEDGQNNGKEIIDSGNTGHVVTQVGTAQLKTDNKKFGSSSVWFDGDSDYLSIPDSDDFNVFASDTEDWTVEFFIKHTDHAGEEYYMTHETDGNNRWVLEHNDGTGIVLYYITGGVVRINQSGGEISDTNWHHIALCKVGNEFGVYKDGTQVIYATTSETLNPTGSLYIAERSPGVGKLLSGYMDEIRIYKGNPYSANPNVGKTNTLTPPTSEHTSDANTKLLLHCNSQDVSGDGGSGTYNIPTFYATTRLSTAEQKFGTASLLLDGDSDYVSLPDSADWDICGSDADNWTIDLWVKHADHVGDETYISQYEDGSNYWQLFHTHGSGLRFQFLSGASQIINTGSGGEITDTDWHHIALCKVADEYGIYKDGVQVVYVQDSDTDTLAGLLRIGQRGDSNYWFSGYLDEVHIQHSNHLSAAPNVGLTDTITVPSAAYSLSSTIYNMTLISNTGQTASIQPSQARIVLFEEDVDSITLNTDLLAYVSRDNAATWTQATLEDYGTFEGDKRILAALVDFTSGVGEGTQMEYKVVTANTKDLKIHGAGLSWD